MLFSPNKRIRDKSGFQQVFKQGKRLRTPFYILYYRPNELSHSRMGVITSKRNIRAAVRRNKTKRVARETFRLQQDKIAAKDIVLVAQKRAGQASKSELRQCLEKLFIKLQDKH